MAKFKIELSLIDIEPVKEFIDNIGKVIEEGHFGDRDSLLEYEYKIDHAWNKLAAEIGLLTSKQLYDRNKCD